MCVADYWLLVDSQSSSSHRHQRSPASIVPTSLSWLLCNPPIKTTTTLCALDRGIHGAGCAVRQQGSVASVMHAGDVMGWRQWSAAGAGPAGSTEPTAADTGTNHRH